MKLLERIQGLRHTFAIEKDENGCYAYFISLLMHCEQTP